MSQKCQICGKKPVAGRTIKRRGLAKKKGGVGRRTTGISGRVFYPNLKKMKALINGSVRTIKVCTRCIKHGKVVKTVH
jgi:large subunit ribosomal protein L28